MRHMRTGTTRTEHWQWQAPTASASGAGTNPSRLPPAAREALSGPVSESRYHDDRRHEPPDSEPAPGRSPARGRNLSLRWARWAAAARHPAGAVAG